MLAFRAYQIRGDQIVAVEPVLPHQPANAASQSQSRNAGRGDHSSRGSQMRSSRLAIKLLPDQTCLHNCRLPTRIHLNAFHARKVNHQGAPSATDFPGMLWPPLRTVNGRFKSRAKQKVFMTSEMLVQQTIANGLRSIIPFHTRRALSKSLWFISMTGDLTIALRSRSCLSLSIAGVFWGILKEPSTKLGNLLTRIRLSYWLRDYSHKTHLPLIDVLGFLTKNVFSRSMRLKEWNDANTETNLLDENDQPSKHLNPWAGNACGRLYLECDCRLRLIRPDNQNLFLTKRCSYRRAGNAVRLSAPQRKSLNRRNVEDFIYSYRWLWVQRWHGIPELRRTRTKYTKLCLGVWEQTGQSTYTLNHFALSYDASSGDLNGKVRIVENVSLESGGDKYSGTFLIEVFDPTGTTVGAHFEGKVSARRITINTSRP